MFQKPFNLGQVQKVFHGLFADHPAHIALISLDGDILAVNDAWQRFGESNGLQKGYEFLGISYLTACQPAVEAGDPYASHATMGLLGLMQSSRDKFTLIYPCHSPVEQRWFRMWAEPQTPDVPAIVVAHQYLGASRPGDEKSDEASALTPQSPFIFSAMGIASAR